MKEKNVGSDGGDKCNGMKLGVGVKDAGSEWKKRVVGQCLPRSTTTQLQEATQL